MGVHLVRVIVLELGPVSKVNKVKVVSDKPLGDGPGRILGNAFLKQLFTAKRQSDFGIPILVLLFKGKLQLRTNDSCTAGHGILRFGFRIIGFWRGDSNKLREFIIKVNTK